MPAKVNIREIVKTDCPLLEEFLYQAIFVPPGTAPPPREIIFTAPVHIYIQDFGGTHDCGVIAESGGTAVGAAWTRIIPAYGHIDNNTPELAISILPRFRGQGIGTKLLTRLFALLRERGYAQTSLAVQKANPAVRFYKRAGYSTLCEKGEEYVMIKQL